MRKRFSSANGLGPQFREIAEARLRAALKAAAEPDKALGERVHAARTQIKKLRALMRLMKPAFPDFRAENRAARDAARLLAPMRDARVLEESLERLRDAAETADPAKALGAAIDARMPTPDRQQQALTAFSDALAPMLGRTAGWQVAGDGAHVLRRGLTKTYRAARHAMRLARQTRKAADFHEWRKRVKHLAHELKLTGELPGGAAEHIDKLKELARLLGQHHDDAAFSAFAVDEGQQYFPLIEAAETDREPLERRALELGEALFAEKPKRIGHSWLPD